MTSQPPSRRARATTLAPRSWPSRPGLAMRTRILALVGAVIGSFCANEMGLVGIRSRLSLDELQVYAVARFHGHERDTVRGIANTNAKAPQVRDRRIDVGHGDR